MEMEWNQIFIGLVIFAIFCGIGIVILNSFNNTVGTHPGIQENTTAIITTLTSTPDASSLTANAKNVTWLNFDGIGDTVVIADDSAFDNSNTTISFWFKTDRSNDIIRKWETSGNQRSWEFHTGSTGKLNFGTSANGSSTVVNSLSQNNVSDNQWHLATATTNGVQQKLYIDGILTDNDTQTGIFSSTSNIKISDSFLTANDLEGSFDDFRIYDHPLEDYQINNMYLIGRDSREHNTGPGYYDNFSSYSVGNDTMRPNWLPQYVGYVNITANKEMQIDSFYNVNGDRDIHAALNVSQISNSIQNSTMQFTFNVTNCNSTFRFGEGISNIGASGYFFYKDGNNFLSFEIKTNSTNTTCGTGDSAQLAIYKRVGGNTVALNSQTLFTFNMNQVYPVKVTFETYNTTNYNFTLSFNNGAISRSSNNITTSEVFNGQYLLENAGTVTLFDNFNLTRPGIVDSPQTYYRINENIGTSIHDQNSLAPIGAITSATFQNDGINLLLVKDSNYTLSGPTFTIISPDFYYNFVGLSYNYQVNAFDFTSPLNNLILYFPLIIVVFIAIWIMGRKQFSGGKSY